jgi:lipoprotein-anchoring transpeptidase ErfK/SrfK
MSAVYRLAAALIAVAALPFIVIPAATSTALARSNVVTFNGDAAPGTIVMRTSERPLYLVLGQGHALMYPVGVGRAGMQWAGRAIIESKRVRPA